MRRKKGVTQGIKLSHKSSAYFGATKFYKFGPLYNPIAGKMNYIPIKLIIFLIFDARKILFMFHLLNLKDDRTI